MKKRITGIMVVALVGLLAGCNPEYDKVYTPTEEEIALKKQASPTVKIAIEAEPLKVPSKEEVLAMRTIVLEGMTEDEKDRLKENVKIANLQMEEAYLYEDIFGQLMDKESMYWNYFDQKGEIQIGWDITGTKPVMANNRFDAENFVALFADMQSTVHNEKLKNDLQYIIDETRLAAETHEMEHANNIYKALHDMDYFLLRYGMDDVGVYVRDKAIIAKYYGVLSVYEEE